MSFDACYHVTSSTRVFRQHRVIIIHLRPSSDLHLPNVPHRRHGGDVFRRDSVMCDGSPVPERCAGDGGVGSHAADDSEPGCECLRSMDV